MAHGPATKSTVEIRAPRSDDGDAVAASDRDVLAVLEEILAELQALRYGKEIELNRQLR